MGKGISIYIDDKDKFDASAVSNSFTDNDTKYRAYINVLGAELTTKYLNSEHIEVPNNFNIHSVKKVLEEFDISDVMLKGLHIDVRVIFDENVIFIPKSHFDYNLTPDVYVVLKFVKDSVNAEFLGFFEPQLINTNNENDDYYFIEKEKLSAPENFTEYVKANNKSIGTGLSDETMDESERIIISFIDNDITNADKKTLLKNLTKSAELREKFIEYENFETLSFQAMFEPTVEKGEIVEDVFVQDEFEMFDQPAAEDISETFEQEQESEQETEEIPTETLGLAEEQETEEISTETLDLAEEQEEIPVEINDTAEEVQNIEVEPLDLEKEPENIEIEPLDLSKDAENTEEEQLELDETVDTTENIELTEPVEDIESVENIEPIGYTEAVEPIENIESVDIQDTFETLEPVEDIDIQEDLSEDTLSFENPYEAPIEVDTDENIATMSFDSVEEFHAEPAAQIIEETVPMEMLENAATGFSNNENAEDNTVEIQNFEDVSKETEVSSDNIDIIPDEDSDAPTFGKNLMENLSYEADEPISDEIQSEIEPAKENTEPAIESMDEANNIAEDTDTVIEKDSDNFSSEIQQENKLDVLYTEDDTTSEIEFVDEDGNNLDDNGNSTNLSTNLLQIYKKQILAAILFLAIVSVGYFTLLKPKSSPDFTAQNEVNGNVAETQNPKIADMSEENILATNAPEISETKKVEVASTKPVQELKNTAQQPKPKTAAGYMDVSKIIWDVPDNMSKNPDIQNYLRTAGKSIKVSLSTDLLLATEYAYSNYVKIGLNIGQTGNIIGSKVLTSSGSTQIDNIVLQSVKDTLNTVKPRSGAVQSPNFNLSIIIYF